MSDHSEYSRRDVLRFGAFAVGTAAALKSGGSASAATEVKVDELTIAQIKERMEAGSLTALQLVNSYLQRIETMDKGGPKLTSVIETNPEARDIARALDAERKATGARGPLHGIPILLKDNIDTADQMQSAAGSLAL